MITRTQLLLAIIAFITSCSQNSLPTDVTDAIKKEYSSRGKASPQEEGSMGNFFFNVKILNSSEMKVPNGSKDMFAEAYCFNFEYDLQTVFRRNDEDKPLSHRVESKIAFIKHSGDVYISDVYGNWKDDECPLSQQH